MGTAVFLRLAFAAFVHVISASSNGQKSTRFVRCDKEEGIYPGNVISSITSPRLRCFEKCAADDKCRSLNVCPSSDVPGQYDCTLQNRHNPWNCTGMITASDPECFHAEKVHHCTEMQIPNQNNDCVCKPCYKGPGCTQHVIDCKEGMELFTSNYGYPFLTCLIQPTTATEPFLVGCNLRYGTTNLINRVQNASGWSELDWASYGWNDYKKGMGNFYKSNYFVGLENMYLFLNQFHYRLNMWNTYHDQTINPVSPSFRKIILGNENNQYALQYGYYTSVPTSSAPNTYESYKGQGIAHPFCTADHDCGTCAKDNGPGWYFLESNGNCTGTSPFAILAQWPQNPGLLALASTDYPMERQ
ncbi:hypothetical protein V1264_006288 [Littorina saxatilis]|uniref:Fibrinogen C-terminal domain-containing protein n=1 Tax=Littorina saxatilis TaxID=31220 RepID=A0AAN9AWL6_9CAEN